MIQATQEVQMERQFYRVSDLATVLGIGKSTVHDWIRAGTIRSKRVNGNVLIPRVEFERLTVDSDSDIDETSAA